MTELAHEISQSKLSVLGEQTRKNERLIGSVRVMAFVLLAISDWIGYLAPQPQHKGLFTIAMPLAATIALMLSLLILLAIDDVRLSALTLLPWVDVALVFALNTFYFVELGPSIYVACGTTTSLALGCALLMVGGTLRFELKPMLITSGGALVVFVAIAVRVQESAFVFFHLRMLLALAVICALITRVVRESVANAVGRAALQSFLPSRVLTGVMDPERLVNEHRKTDATVLFSDLRGFTSQAEHLAPEDVLAFLSRIQGAFAEAVRVHGGTVDKFMGDGMLAVFGAFDAAADHADRAVRASLAMRESLATINEDLVRKGGQPVRIGIGVHSGALVVGCLGAGAHAELTVIGDTVNTASRVEELTKQTNAAWNILISGDTALRLAQGSPLLRKLHPLGEFAIRGRQRGLAVHALAG